MRSLKHLPWANILVILVNLTLVSTSCELFYEQPVAPTIHALYIACDYKNNAYPSDNLHGTIRDAKELSAAMEQLATLKGLAYSGTTMFQEGTGSDSTSALYPTRTNVLAQLKTINTQITDTDILFVYYSGHGYLDTANGEASLALPSFSSFSYTYLGVSELQAQIKSMKGSKVLVLDSCYSGQFVDDYDETTVRLNLDYDPRFFTIAASLADGVSHEDVFFRDMEDYATKSAYHAYDTDSEPDDPVNHYHGHFTYYLLEALGWNQSDGMDETIDTDGVLTHVSGYLDTDHPIPAQNGNLITIGDLYRYSIQKVGGYIDSGVARWPGFYNQCAQINDGPLDMVLFSDTW